MKFIFGLALQSLLLVFFNWIGWLHLLQDGKPADSIGAIFAAAFTISIVFAIMATLLIVCTFGFILILFPLLGWIFMGAAASWMPEYIYFDRGLFVFLCGTVVGLLWLYISDFTFSFNKPRAKNSKKT